MRPNWSNRISDLYESRRKKYGGHRILSFHWHTVILFRFYIVETTAVTWAHRKRNSPNEIIKDIKHETRTISVWPSKICNSFWHWNIWCLSECLLLVCSPFYKPLFAHIVWTVGEQMRIATADSIQILPPFVRTKQTYRLALRWHSSNYSICLFESWKTSSLV